MAIVPLVRATIYGSSREKTSTLESLQELGFLHLISYGTVETPAAQEAISTDTHDAYQYLKHCPKKRRQVMDPSVFNQAAVEIETLALKERTRTLNDEKDHLLRRIKALEPWGDFDFSPLGPEGYRLWFYIVPLYRMKDVEKTDFIWECVYRDNRFAYVVVVAREEPETMPVPRTHTGAKSLDWLKKRLETVETELEDFYWRRVGLTRWCYLFSQVLASADDQAALNKAAEKTFDNGSLFVIEAWVPHSCTRALEDFAEKNDLLLTTRLPRKNEVPPTLLDNPELFSGGEKLVQFYTTPGYRLWDPSLAVFLSFVIFFSMIISDAGYGILLALLLLVFRRRIQCSSPPLCNLFTFLVAGTVAYGMLAGSYFGLTPPEGTLLNSLKVLDVHNQNQMMGLSIIIGIIHLMFAHAVNFFQTREVALKLPPLGWIAILGGGLLTWAAHTGFIPGRNLELSGLIILGTGAAAVLLFSSLRPWRKGTWKDRLWRLLDGLLALGGLSRAFGDVLSYLRLFALGLASAQLAVTFNNLAADIARNIAGVGTLLAILVLFFGHGLNFLLAIMSGVVHGLRLNFIEFFNWGLAEEGHPFRAFSKKGLALWKQSSSPSDG